MDIVPLHLEEVDSTNTWAKTHCPPLNANQITRISASMQTKGRGRFGRPWLSPKDKNIYVSFCFIPPKEALLPHLVQLACLSSCQLIENYGLTPQIKWPNDLMIQEQKIGGVLCEPQDHYVIIGIGLNVNMGEETRKKIDQKATSFFLETKQTFDLKKVLDDLSALFIKALLFYQKEGFSPFFKHYQSLLLYLGEMISCEHLKTSLLGIFHSVTFEGAMNLLLPSGDLQLITSGDIKCLRRNTLNPPKRDEDFYVSTLSKNLLRNSFFMTTIVSIFWLSYQTVIS